jgi:uncharacterized SAM-dependent methyltransferase
MPLTLTFHDSQYPAQIAEQLRHGLRTKHLSSKFLYDSPAQAQRWLAYHQAYSPSRTEPNLLALYQQAFQTALDTCASPVLHYVSLGCGGGMKDVLLLQQAQAHCQSLYFTPMDTSAALVLETMLRLQQTLPSLPSFPLVVDLDVEPDLTALLAQSETPDTVRLLACFGMIPNFDYRTFLPYVRSLMRPSDLLLLSANLSPTPYPTACAHILPQYDNPLAHAWFTGLLDSLGFPATDLEVRIDAHTLQADGHIWQIRTTVQFHRDIELTVDDHVFAFSPAEPLQVFFSNRFTHQAMPHVLAQAGLPPQHTFLFASQEEGIYLCRRSA